MATAQCMMPKEKTGTWSHMFPNEQLTAQKSLMFVKRLIAVAVSSITYLRAIFPEHAFGDRRLEDLNLKILKDDSSCDGACQVIKWIKGCFDAIEKKYLRTLIIGIYVDPEDPETVIESYTFKISYNDGLGIDIFQNDSKITSAYNSTETKKATIKLLRTIILLTQSLHSLPDEAFMTMKLLYYDEVTPHDYEPPGFQQAASDGFNFQVHPMNIKVGDVTTPFHTIKLRIKTDSKQFETEEAPPEFAENQSVSDTRSVAGVENANDSDAKKDTTPRREESTQNGSFQVVPEPFIGDDAPGTPNQTGTDLRTANTSSQEILSQESQNGFGVCCGCGCNEDDGLMILCAKCNMWQHAVCYKIIKEEDAPEKHICDKCADPTDPNLQPSDPHLHSLSPIAREATCLWRRTLFVCQETNKIVVPNLAKRLGIETTVAHGLVSRLEKEGYVKSAKNKRQGKVIDKEKLKAGLEKYLTVNKEKENDVKMKLSKAQNHDDPKMEIITSQAENMNLCGIKKTTNETEGADVKLNTVEQKQNPRKRTRAKLAKESCEFEISNSQEASQGSYAKDQCKRRKSSIARKAIRV